MLRIENLMLVPPDQLGENLVATWFRWRRILSQETDVRQRAESVLEWLNLSHVRHELAQNLSGGQKKLLELGRTLMINPQLILLDEPTAGLSPLYVEQIFTIMRDIHCLGISLLVVEQNAKQALGTADRGYVLAMGTNRYEDTGQNLLQNPQIAEMFLAG